MGESKAVITNIFFDGPEKMRDAARRMIRSVEMPILKMFGWPLAA